jgi:type II secretory pathway component GspD/PulD (secretin)
MTQNLNVTFPVGNAFRIVWSGLLLLLPIPVHAQSLRPTNAPKSALAQVVSVRAFEAGQNTLVDVELQGACTPVLTGEGKQWTLMLPHVVPSPTLPESMTTGGQVGRIGLTVADSPERAARIRLTLNSPAQAVLTERPNKRTIRVALSAEPNHPLVPVVHKAKPGYFDLNAYQTDLAMLVNSLARDAGASILLMGSNHPKVTVSLRQVTVEEAIQLLSKSAGLIYRKQGETYLIGNAKDLDPPAPAPVESALKPDLPKTKWEVYRCKHIVAAELVKSLQATFEKEALKVGLGASGYSPRLDAISTGNVTGAQTSASNGGAGPNEAGLNAREVILSGEETLVDQAVALAQKLDRRRAQVRIGVKISDISSEALREMGVRWNWSSYAAREVPNLVPPVAGGGAEGGAAPPPLVGGISFGAFAHDPTFIEASLSALEKNDQAKLLAAPTLSLLDGERGFILIGDRLVFPVLVGFTQANTPIFNKTEERVGIYMQVAVQIADNDEITLTIYPQVSVVTNFLVVNGASYPQISTREQQTTIRVKHGEKIVVGGLIREEEVANIQRVPLLSRIPFFGELFTYRKKNRRKSEVIIMITPEMLKD